MKITINFFALTFMMLLCMSSNTHAYTWGFSNHTKQTLVLRLRLLGWNENFYRIIGPGKRQDYSWGAGRWFAGYCMLSVKWASYDSNMKVANITNNGGLDMFREQNLVDNDKFDKLPYNYHDVEIIYLEDKLYQQTLKEAANIGKGFDTFLCSAVGLLKIVNGNCPSIFADLINWFGGIIAKSSCKSREFEIIKDEKGEVFFFTLLN